MEVEIMSTSRSQGITRQCGYDFMVKGKLLALSLSVYRERQRKPNDGKYVVRNQNTMCRRSIKAAALTVALACVLATGAEVRSSSAAQVTHFHRHGEPHLVNTDRNGGLEGIASVYYDRITANGEHMNPDAMTAAHKSLPMGSMVTVFNKGNGRSVTVRINDRGPYVAGRVIDLSPGAARVLGVDGLAPVSLRRELSDDAN
jgi:rare lipoprotein A (peptidoglycan hydrolase)